MNKNHKASGSNNIDINKLRENQLKTQAHISSTSKKAQAELEEKKRLRKQAKDEIIRKINEESSPTVVNTKKIKNEPLGKQFTHKIKLFKDEVVVPKQNIQETQEKLSYTLQMEAISSKQIDAYKKRRARKSGINVNDKFIDLDPKISRIYFAVVIPLIVAVSILLYIKAP